MTAEHGVLFLCTGNSARSIFGEALLRHWGRGRFRAYSAGSHPKGAVHPMAINVLERNHLPVDGLRSKSWDEFAAPDAPRMDFIITVCDNAAGEACPIWPGHPTTAHWGFEDPAAMEGSDEEKRAAFEKIFNQITTRMNAFVSLPMHTLDEQAIRQEIRKIGEMQP